MTEANRAPKPAPVPPGGWPVPSWLLALAPLALIARTGHLRPASTPRVPGGRGLRRGALCRTHLLRRAGSS